MLSYLYRKYGKEDTVIILLMLICVLLGSEVALPMLVEHDAWESNAKKRGANLHRFST